MNLLDFRRIAPSLYKSGISLELQSGPGLGKSSAVYQVGADLSKQLEEPVGSVTMILSSLDSTDVRGYLMPQKIGEMLVTRFTMPAIFPGKFNVDIFIDGERLTRAESQRHCEEHGVPLRGILFLDEFAQAYDDVRKPMGSVLLDKQLGEYELPDGWVCWAASNRMQDRSGVNKPLMFLENRRCLIDIDVHLDSWKYWAQRHNVHPLTQSFADQFPQVVFQDSVPTEDGPFCTPRSLCLLSDTLESMRPADMPYEHLPNNELSMEVAGGWIGKGPAAEFMTHLRLIDDLPTTQDVIKRPREAKLPDRVDAQYVMAAMLPHYTDRKNVGKIITYVRRLPHDLQTIYVTSLVSKDAQMMSTTEMVEWCADNSELMLAAAAF